MDQELYIKERVDNQIEWYDVKSNTCQKRYKIIQVIEIVSASAIPILSGYATKAFAIPIVIGILGAVIAIMESIVKLEKYHENWIEYRSTCELLRYQKNLFLTSSSPYSENGEESTFNVFVKNIEQIISSENNQWKIHNTKDKPDDKKQ